MNEVYIVWAEIYKLGSKTVKVHCDFDKISSTNVNSYKRGIEDDAETTVNNLSNSYNKSATMELKGFKQFDDKESALNYLAELKSKYKSQNVKTFSIKEQKEFGIKALYYTEDWILNKAKRMANRYTLEELKDELKDQEQYVKEQRSKKANDSDAAVDHITAYKYAVRNYEKLKE